MLCCARVSSVCLSVLSSHKQCSAAHVHHSYISLLDKLPSRDHAATKSGSCIVGSALPIDLCVYGVICYEAFNTPNTFFWCDTYKGETFIFDALVSNTGLSSRQGIHFSHTHRNEFVFSVFHIRHDGIVCFFV